MLRHSLPHIPIQASRAAPEAGTPSLPALTPNPLNHFIKRKALSETEKMYEGGVQKLHGPPARPPRSLTVWCEASDFTFLSLGFIHLWNGDNNRHNWRALLWGWGVMCFPGHLDQGRGLVQAAMTLLKWKRPWQVFSCCSVKNARYNRRYHVATLEKSTWTEKSVGQYIN